MRAIMVAKHATPEGDAVVGSVLFGQYLRLCIAVRIETCPLALRPGGSLLRATDVPIGTAALQHGAQVEAQLFPWVGGECPPSRGRVRASRIALVAFGETLMPARDKRQVRVRDLRTRRLRGKPQSAET